mmetsp:Transcript_25163/g.87798  ORF Transcript_25163/g.87798 Transcript_25163/m.87798 type:complete len:247 (-) Transcript_25163:308-1048(-)
MNCRTSVTTTEEPPPAMIFGMSTALSLRRHSSCTAKPASSFRWETVGRRSLPSSASSAGSRPSITLKVTMTRLRASSTLLRRSASSWMRAFFSGTSQAARLAKSRVVECMTTSTMVSLLASSVLPVAVLSTMRSTSSGGSASVAPYARKNSASMPRFAIHSFVRFWYSDATITRRFPGVAAEPFSRMSARGAAATTRTGSIPVSSTSTISSASPSSCAQSSPPNPTSRVPVCSMPRMFCGFRSLTS